MLVTDNVVEEKLPFSLEALSPESRTAVLESGLVHSFLVGVEDLENEDSHVS
jgi:hypothetical protein